MKRVRVYIDIENMSVSFVEKYFSISNGYGEVISKKVYGNYGSSSLSPWRKIEKDYGLDWVQVSSINKGKSTADIKLIVDLLSDFYLNKEDVFVLISSDSDFLEVAKKIRSNHGTIININNLDNNVVMSNHFTASHSIKDMAISKNELVQHDLEPLSNAPKANKTKKVKKAKKLTKEKIFNEIREIILKLEPTTKSADFSLIIGKLYSIHDKNEVKRVLGFSKKAGIAKAFSKCSTLQLTKKNRYITVVA